MKPDRTIAIEAEQSVIGALLLSNDAIDRIGDLQTEHFYRADHREIYGEIEKQILACKTADVISVGIALAEKITDCLQYLNSIVQSTPSAANIRRYADIVVDRSVKRALIALGSEAQELAATSPDEAGALVDIIATKIDAIAQKKTRSAPVRMSESLGSYADMLDARMQGKIKPIPTGFVDLDKRLDGGLERGTLTVIAGRPAMGKTAAGLGLCRNVAAWGSSLLLSMEMSIAQLNDRNIAALGKLPVSWLRLPTDGKEDDKQKWSQLTYAYQKAAELNFYIDDETSLNMLDIRNKARQVKRKNGLDLLVIDQLSFITGGTKEKKTYELIGEYTRGLIGVAKQMDVAVVLMCQLNRDCESRPNKRPQLSDLAMSGSIEQDASNVIFLYRDEIYNPNTQEKGLCEVNCAKQRQGEPGIVALSYIGNQTRFEDLAHEWHPAPPKQAPTRSRGMRDE
jgi:replicative DNA helicase